MKHVVIGTAGHVDHGKTALVKALTGTDTDRFPEEKARGITIDIGFASLTLPDGTGASVVDVPGHEDFVRNMVAGATGVDVALLVIAADEGVMPQTIEHLAILDLLGVRAGVIALTKCDLAEADWLDLVRGDVSARVSETGVEWDQPVPVSAVTGQGLDDLRAALGRAAARAVARSVTDLFRLPVDRVFSLPGAGTVVTGTAWSGTVSVGDEVTVLPGGATARVRSVEVHGDRRERAEPGRRAALALTGLERSAAERGSVVVADASWRETTSLDVRVTLLPSAPRPLTQRSRIRFHLGTAEIMARVTPATDDIQPGDTGLVRVRLDEPVVARWGDRAIIRSYSPVTTIGGGLVVDPWPGPRPRRPVSDPRKEGPDPGQRALAMVDLCGTRGMAATDFAVRAGVPAGDVAQLLGGLLSAGTVVRVGAQLVSAAAIANGSAAILSALTRYHAVHPLEPGMPLELLRQLDGTEGIADHVLNHLSSQGMVVHDGAVARLANHRAALDSAQETVSRKVLEALLAAGFEGRTLADLEPMAGPGQVRRVVEFLVRQGTAIRVGPDRYYHQELLTELVRKALGEMQHSGGSTPAQLRDSLGLTRKYLIPFLDWLDGRGWTVRVGDGRRVTAAGVRYLNDTGAVETA